MKTCKDYEFGKNFIVYVIDNNGEQSECFHYQYYLDNKSKYKGKTLVICHEDLPVYFRKG